MQNDLQLELQKLGFYERHARVYVTLLRLGKSGVFQLARGADVPRASCYDILQRLLADGMVRQTTEAGQQMFLPEPPERILSLLRLQRQEIADREEHAARILPQLTALMADGVVKPRVRLIADLQEILDLHREYTCLAEPILQLVGYDAFTSLQKSSVVTKQHERLGKEKSRGRSILVTDKPVEAPLGSLFEVRCIPPDLLVIKGEMTVCGDRVLLFTYVETLFAVEIISASLADTCRLALELAWQKAGEFTDLARK